MAGPATSSSGIDRGTMMALVAMALGVFLIANDFTALTVAIPEIEDELDTTLNRAQWVINAYTVVFGVLIVTGGRLADLLGRKRVFVVGATIFATFSLLGAFAPGIGWLIAARAAMAVGGAMVWPAVLGMTYALLPEDKAGLAGGLIIGVAGIGNAVGPLIGGVLTDTLGWRWVFILNVPITAIAILVTLREVDESAEAERHRIDYRGILTLSTGVVLLLVALDQGTVAGFADPVILALFVVGAGLLAAFVVVEGRAGTDALVPRALLASRQFAASIGAVLMMSAIFFAVIVYVPQFVEDQMGWSALAAGAGLLPLMAVFAATSFVAGPLYNRLGARAVIGVGASCLTIGVGLLAWSLDDSFEPLVPGLLVLGVGVGFFYSSVTTAAVTAVDDSQSSLAGGIVYMCQIAGGSIGLGLNTAIVLSAPTEVEGISRAFAVDAALGVVGTVVVLAFIGREDHGPFLHRHRRHHRAHG